MGLLQDVLARFGRTIGLNDLAFDSEDMCALTVDGDLEVYFQAIDYAAGVMRLNGRVALASDVSPETLRDLLVSSHNGRGTGDAAFSIDNQTDEVLLGRALYVNKMTDQEFDEAVTLFLRYVAFWNTQIAELEAPSLKSAPARDDLASGSMPLMMI